jgi:thioredoxin reductase (NADPH)
MITVQTLRQIPLFASASDNELARIASRSADVRVLAGEWVLHEGEAPAFFALLEGRLEILKNVGRAEHVLESISPGDFFGELSLILGAPLAASFRAIEPSRMLRVERADFQDVIAVSASINNKLLEKMALRISKLQEVAFALPAATAIVIGRHWDLECHNLRDFLARDQIAYRWLDPDDIKAQQIASPEVLAANIYPVVVFPDNTHLVAPTYRALAEQLGLQTVPLDTTYDVAIVGAGPAGLASAVYGASEGLRTILIESSAPGGQAGTSSRIENYLGFPAGLSGDELSTRALQQARHFGAELLVARTVTDIEPRGDSSEVHTLVLDGGDRIKAKALIVATGVAWRKLAVPGADALLGRGVYYGAARTEALATRGKHIFLVGGGNSAGQAAMLFSNYACSVTIVVRGDGLAASVSRYLIDELATKENVQIEVLSDIVNIIGNDRLESLVIESRSTGEQRTCAADALFVFIGADAETAWLPSVITRDSLGYICTGRDVADFRRDEGIQNVERDPYLLESSVPGIFAAGDVRHASIKRVASSVGEGSMAIAFVHQYLAEQSTLLPTAVV